MIAAVYARKSTDQHGVAEDQKSVTRQIDHARAYARRKGWQVADGHVYVDDGISGAEFSKRPGLLRLMNALKPKPGFQVLIMSEESRLGREQLEVGYALKQIMQAGVRVFFYLEDRERTLDSPTDKIMLSLTAFADELEREKARQRTYDALQRKARSGHVTGGRTFGYDNVSITDASGRRSHVERRINDAEAAVVRRIFQLCADGVGQSRTARQLNAEGAVAPRAQHGRPSAWSPSSVHEVLFRDLYRGVVTWNRSRKRNHWGQRQQTPRPEQEWIQIPLPALRVVSDDQWEAAHRRLRVARVTYEQQTHGQRRPHRDRDSKYLLPGFGRCARCSGGLHVRTRAHGSRRAFFYACTSHHNCGPEVCTHADQWPMEELDREVLATIAGDVLRPALVDEVITAAKQLFDETSVGKPEQQEQLRRKLATVERELSRYADAIASGAGQIPALVERMRTAEEKRRGLVAQIERSRETSQPPAWRELERRMRASLKEWRSQLTGDVAHARQAFRQLLTTPIRFTPFVHRGMLAIRFEGQWGLEAVFGGVLTKMASPTGFEPVFWP
jgi:site-specific DNA recombinase